MGLPGGFQGERVAPWRRRSLVDDAGHLGGRVGLVRRVEQVGSALVRSRAHRGPQVSKAVSVASWTAPHVPNQEPSGPAISMIP
jgi:hypothetical protein